MSLSTEDAIRGAVSDIKNACLCLLDATDVDCSGEKEELEYVARRLTGKLHDYDEQDKKQEEE